ncbi:MAG: IS21 family transposase [Paraclostridium sp.]
MNFKINIMTEIKLKTVKELHKLRVLMEANNLEKPNFSELARKYGVDRRTVKKYYEGNINTTRKPKKSKIDQHYDKIKSLLSAESPQVFKYKSHLYRYLQRECKLECSRSNFNYFISKHKEFEEYFKPKAKTDSVKSETPLGKQAQFDWKEKIQFKFRDGTKIELNVGSLVLSASRFKVWSITPSTNQKYLFDFLANAFEIIGGVPDEILIDNASTMMDKARTENSKGKINPKFSQFASDFGFTIKPCIRARPQTKAKVENPMKIIDEIMNYNGILSNLEELHEKMNMITNEANTRVCQATGLPPIVIFNKEKEHLLPLPHAKVCSSYKNSTYSTKVNTNALFKYKENLYSVPSDLIGKTVSIEVIEDNLNVYYNKKLITIHEISRNKINYNKEHHEELMELTFKNKEKEELKDFAEMHFRELEKFNEQLSTIAT